MENNELTTAGAVPPAPQTLSGLLKTSAVKARFAEVLQEKGEGFLASVLSVVNNNALLQKAEPTSILSAAMVAATLDLPVTPGLGFAALVPYNDSKNGRCLCQFQIMTRGLVQLALRTGLYKKIEVNPVHTGEIENFNKFTGDITFGEATDSNIVGYLGFFELVNGFRKFLYMTVEELTEHGKKYSQTARRGFGLWIENFDAMASKTVLKLMLAKWGPLSTAMQTAVLRDQTEGGEPRSVDNPPATPAPTADFSPQNAKIIEEVKQSREKCVN